MEKQFFMENKVSYNLLASLIFDQYTAQTHIIINSTGKAKWYPPSTLKTTCPLDLTNYPFDEQKCELMFGSWTHHSGEINITTSGDAFLMEGPWYTNPEWLLTNWTTQRHEFNFPNFGVYTALSMTVNFKRNTSFYQYAITLPSIAAMIILLTIFWLPSHSSLRFTLATISLFITLSLLLYLGIKLGVASIGVPLAIRNLSTMVLLIGIAIMFSTLSYQIMCFCISSNISVPIWISNLLNGVLGQILMISDACIANNKQSNSDRMQLTPEDASPGGEMSLAVISHQKDWLIVFTFIDRMLFLTYFIILVVKHA